MSTYKYLNDTGLTYLWGKIKAFFKTYYGTCSTGASTQMKEVTCPGFVLVAGARIDVKFTNAQTFNASDSNPLGLNVNNTGNKQVMRMGTTILPRYAWQAGEVVRFVYDGTRWVAQNNGIATTTYYGRTKLSNSVSSTSNSLSATPSAVKQAYDLANGANTQATTNAGNIATNTSNITANTNKISELDQYVTGNRGPGTGVAGVGASNTLLYVELNKPLTNGMKVHIYIPDSTFLAKEGSMPLYLSISGDTENATPPYYPVLEPSGGAVFGYDYNGKYIELYYNGSNWIIIGRESNSSFKVNGDLAVTGTVTSTGGFTGNLSGNATTSTSSDSSTYSNKAKELDNYYTPDTRPTSANVTADGSGTLRKFLATSSMTEGKPPHDAHIIHMSWDNTYGYDAQIAISNEDPPQAWIRAGTTGNWGNWEELIRATEFNLLGTYTSVTGTYTTKAWSAGTVTNCTWTAPRTGKYMMWMYFQPQAESTAYIYKQLQASGTATRPMGNILLFQGGPTSGGSSTASIIAEVFSFPITATAGQTIYPYIHTPVANLVWNIKITGMYVGR